MLFYFIFFSIENKKNDQILVLLELEERQTQHKS